MTNYRLSASVTLVVLGLAVLPAQTLGQQQERQASPQIQEQLRRASGEAAHAEQALSKKRYEEAMKASGPGARQERAATAIDFGRSTERLAEAEGREGSLAEAQRAYAEAIRDSSNEEKWLPQHHLGQLLVKMDQPAQAIETYEKIDLSKVDEAERFKVDFGYAQALEGAGDSRSAYQKYRAVIASRPDFTLAADRAFEVLSKSGQSAQTAEFVEFLISKNRSLSAGEYLEKAFEQWGQGAANKRLLASLLRYYAAESVTPLQFRSGDDGFSYGLAFLTELKSESPALSSTIDQIARAFEADWDPLAGNDHAREIFSNWSGTEWEKSSMSLLLSSVGGYYRTASQPRPALAAFSASWDLDETNSAAALSAAGLLVRHAREIDPDARVLNWLVSEAYDQKARFYRDRDWPSILRMHVLLGAVYEGLGRWSSDGPDNALFQWARAVHASQMVPNDTPFTGAYRGLAAANAKTGDPRGAITNYLIAAEADRSLETTPDIQSAAREARAVAERYTSTSINPGSILWVDDNPHNNRYERDALSQLGFSFAIAESTSDAVQILEAETFDVVITDFRRRDDQAGGYTLLDRVKEAWPSTPVIIYSGTATSEQQADARKRGALAQTNSPSELFDLVAKAASVN